MTFLNVWLWDCSCVLFDNLNIQTKYRGNLKLALGQSHTQTLKKLCNKLCQIEAVGEQLHLLSPQINFQGCEM